MAGIGYIGLFTSEIAIGTPTRPSCDKPTTWSKLQHKQIVTKVPDFGLRFTQ